MDARYILQIIADAERPPDTPGIPPEEPGYIAGLQRGVRNCPPPEAAQRERITVPEARQRIRLAMHDYLAGLGGTLLLIKASPGVGKTTAAVELAEELALKRQRVLYAGPRHDFFGDIMAIAGNRALWYEWLPHQAEDPERGKPGTCTHVEAITAWMDRGYESIEFCKRVCGWDAVADCPYHLQKKRHEPCIFGQHQHVVLGHPLKFDVVIGDEDPCQAFPREWKIPAQWVYVRGLDPTEPLAEVLHRLAALCEDPDTMAHGENLLALLGGASQVLAACENFRMPMDASVLAPEIHKDEDVSRVPYAHLQYTVPMLAREAAAAKTGLAYPHRIFVGKGNLKLLLRHTPSPDLPPHIIWLDGTGNPRLYEACFGRQVQVVDAQPRLMARVYQVVDRANGKTSVLTSKNGKTGKAEQLEAQVARIIQTHGYRRPAVISYMRLIEQSETFRNILHTHFYAARGTNALEDVDALFICGVPQPPIDELVRLATMLYWERMGPFARDWACKLVPYQYVDPQDGEGRAYPVAGFWSDLDLHAVLWSLREAELLQAAHRCRPVNKPVDIWLLFNLPIEELPPTRLLSIAEIFGAPEGVHVYRWPDVLEVARRYSRERGSVTTSDLVRELGITRHTAGKYIETLIREHGWRTEAAAREGPGKRPKGAKPPEFVH